MLRRSLPALAAGLCLMLSLSAAPAHAQAPAGAPALSGEWCLEKMEVHFVPEARFEGWMKVNPDEASGRLMLKMVEDGAYGLQDIRIRGVGSESWAADGSIVEAENWIADRLLFRMEGSDRLVGNGTDDNDSDFSFTFRRGACERLNS